MNKQNIFYTDSCSCNSVTVTLRKCFGSMTFKTRTLQRDYHLPINPCDLANTAEIIV